MRIGVIGDTHEPATHPGYLHFVADIFAHYDVEDVVHIGDVVDFHSISFHAKNPESPSPLSEYEIALARIRLWQKVFPKMTVIIGNHDARVARLAASVNIPGFFLRPLPEVFETPGWEWVPIHTIDDVVYTHGSHCRGIMQPALRTAKSLGASVVMGHVHSTAGVAWITAPSGRRLFGMDVGCGVDINNVSMSYHTSFLNKPVLGCGVVLDGIPIHHIMPCCSNEKYHKDRFTGKRRPPTPAPFPRPTKATGKKRTKRT